MKILIVEDNMILCGMIEKWLQKAGYEVLTAMDEPGARSILKKNEINLVLGDVRLPEGNGISLLEWMMRSNVEVPFIVMTDYACITDAVRAIKLGAKDYLQKPVHQEQLIELVHSMLKQPVIVRKECSFVERTSEAARKSASLARRVAPSDLSVMIFGSSGSGKEVIAQMIHRYSDRRDKPFVAVNCGSIPNDLQASEFFGVVKGAFTGAIRMKPGKFEAAGEGTIFLDEIGLVPFHLQSKLLNVLQERSFERVGGNEPIVMKARVIAATNANLEQCVENGTFRRDLYYRLNVIQLEMPPLRYRRADLKTLTEKFIKRFCESFGKPVPEITADFWKTVNQYNWPGNIRELENAIESAVALCGDQLSADCLPLRVGQVRAEERGEEYPKKEVPHNLKLYLKQQEDAIIQEALDKFNGRKEKAAQYLGISDRTLRYKLSNMGKTGKDNDSEELE